MSTTTRDGAGGNGGRFGYMADSPVIFRCMHCGFPLRRSGRFLRGVEGADEANAYLEKHEHTEQVLIRGLDCCDVGDVNE